MVVPALIVATMLASGLNEQVPDERSEERSPLFGLQVGAALGWRSYTLTPNSGLGVAYRTSRPYPGILVNLELNPSDPHGMLPLPEGTSLAGHIAERLGLEVCYSRGWAQSQFMDASARMVTSRSSEWRATIDVLYRIGVPLQATRLTEVRAKLGFGLHRFALEQEESGFESFRRSVRLGVEVVQPFILSRPGRLALRAGVVFLPSAGPGSETRTAHGLLSEGWGVEVSAGAQGALDEVFPGLGWRFGADYTRYADRLYGPGLASQGGRAVEGFPRIVLAATSVW